MMTPAQFSALKRDIIERMVDEMPDEALGELIDTMREMLTHYGSKAQHEQEQATAPTVANRNELAALLKQREAAAKKIEPAEMGPFVLERMPTDEEETAPVEMDTKPFKQVHLPDEEADEDTLAREAKAAAYARRADELKAAKQAARKLAQRKATTDDVNAEKPHSITHRGSLLARLEEARSKNAAEQGG